MVDSNINYVIAKRSEMEEIISTLKQKANIDGEISFPTGVLDLVNNIEVGQPGYAGGNIETDVTGDICGNVYGSIQGVLDGTVYGNESGYAILTSICGGGIRGTIGGSVDGSIYGAVHGDIEGGVRGTVYGCGHEDGFAITGGVQGHICGDICGDVCGNVYGNFFGSIQGCGNISLNNYLGDSAASFSFWDGEITNFCGNIRNPNYLKIIGCGNIQTFDEYFSSYDGVCNFSLYNGMIENFSGFIYSPSNLRVSGCGYITGESSDSYGDLYFGFYSELNDGGLYNFSGTINGGNITFLNCGMIRFVDTYDSNFSDINVTAGHLSFICGNVKYGSLYLTNYGTCGNITSYINEGDESSAYRVELESEFVANISGTLNRYNDCLQYSSGAKTEMIINGQTYCGYAFIEG